MEWEPLPKPAEVAETRLIGAILEGHFPPGSYLPAERELAGQLGVTRPTLREALQRLGRDGWLEIRHGRATRVRDFWKEGNLGVLGAIARHHGQLPDDFVANLLAVRTLLAPTYTRLAVERAPGEIEALLQVLIRLEDNPLAFARADLELHCQLTIASGNPVFTLILNGFRELYENMAQIYFNSSAARSSSRAFYRDLLAAIEARDSHRAESVTQQVMEDSLNRWLESAQENGGGS
jgi:GntR family negative regulator for fad regulon and positive regulator of fabA